MKIFDVSSYGANCLSVVRVNKPKINSLNTNRTDTVAFKAVNKSMVIENLPIEKFKNIASEKIRCLSPENKYLVISEFTEVIDKFLQNKWDIKANADKYKFAVNSLREIIGERGNGNFAIAQINPNAGDVESNALKAIKYIKTAESIGLDAIVFPELTLMGVPMRDTVDRHSIIAEENLSWLNKIAKNTQNTKVLIGFAEPVVSESGEKEYYNSFATLADGKILDIRRIPLTSRASSNEGEINTIDIQGHSYSIILGKNTISAQNILKERINKKPEAIINVMSSPSKFGNEQKRDATLSKVSKDAETPILYVNQVGALDEYSYDGASRVYNSGGELVSRAKSFDEQFMIVNPLNKEIGKIYPLSKGLEKVSEVNTEFSLDYENDLGRIYDTIVQGVKDYFQKNNLKKAVLGLSGGLDSTISAVILADAIGAENVYGISMPSKITSEESRNDARILADNLGIHFDEIPIKDSVTSFNDKLLPLFNRMEKVWDNRYKESFVQDNLQARSRATVLWGISNAFGNTIPIATSDKSELYMGYATINGDMSGGFAPLADVTKTKLFALAKWMNENREVKNAIPQSVIAKPPGAELAIDAKTGKPLIAEDALMPYEFMDEVIWRIENKNENYDDMIESVFLYEKTHNLSKEQKAEWLNKFFKRMSSALYKWVLLPPSVVVDAHSINRKDYVQPVMSNHIKYSRSVEQEMNDKIAKTIDFMI
ncbi:NAD(+) synthase [bacterium]|nr:NAD(+) synthase [bacterium]